MKEAFEILSRMRDQAFAQERSENEYHQDTVRLVLLRMDPNNLVSQMLPSNEEIAHILKSMPDVKGSQLEQFILHETSSPLPELTSMIWEVKGSAKNVVNPNQVILVGGGGKKHDDAHPIRMKDIIKTARAEALEEVHLIAHKPMVIEGASYTYSFDHPRVPDHKGKKRPGRLKNTTFLVSARAAPHDRVNFFDPQDKLQNILQLRPTQVSRLLNEEAVPGSHGKIFTLLDSLSLNEDTRLDAKITGDLNEVRNFRAAIEDEAYAFEARIIKRVLSHLSKVPGNQLKDGRQRDIARLCKLPDPATKADALAQIAQARAALKSIEHSYNDKTKHPILFVENETFQELVKRGVSEHRLKARMKLISDVELAAQRVSEELTVEYYKETGPQFPLLLANIMAEKPYWSTHSYELISQSPELKHVVDTACRVFGINPTHNGWYAKMAARLQEFRLLERNDPQTYYERSRQLQARFCNPDPATGVHAIGEPIKLGKLSEKVETFFKQQFAPLSRKIDTALLTSMRPDQLGSTTQEIGELMLRMFGISQYDGQEISASERNAAMMKMVEMIRIDRVDKTVVSKTNTHIRPLRSAMDRLLGSRVGVMKTASGTVDRHVIPIWKIDMFKDLISLQNTTIYGVDFSKFDIPITFSVRVKDEYSVYRKDLERGGIDTQDEDLSDIFGFMTGLDIHQFKYDLLREYPSLPPYAINEVVHLWQRWASQLFLNAIMMQVDADNGSHTTHFRLYKGRVSETMDGLLSIEDQQKGSASSDSKWEWIKYVMEMHDDTGAMFQVEMQHFPSIEDLVKKKLDDSRFQFARLFDHAPGRYPIIRVLFGMQDAYDDVMRAFYERRNLRRQFRLVWWRRLRLHVYSWLKNMTEEDAVMYADDY